MQFREVLPGVLGVAMCALRESASARRSFSRVNTRRMRCFSAASSVSVSSEICLRSVILVVLKLSLFRKSDSLTRLDRPSVFVEICNE